MRASAFTLLLSLPLCACSPKAEEAAGFLAPDCAQPFEAQVTVLTAQARLTPAPEDYAEPYKFYSSEDGHSSYLITKPGAPAHPAIMMQRASGNDVKTSGCRYGAQKPYDQLLAYLEGLKTWRR